jgi:hypothetical protein
MRPETDGVCYACGRPPGGAGRAAVLVLLCAALLAGGLEAALRALPRDGGKRQAPPAPAEPSPLDNWVGRLRDDLVLRQKECADLRQENQSLLAEVDRLKEEQERGRAAVAALERQVRSQRRELDSERIRQQEELAARERRARFAEELASLYKGERERARQQVDRLVRAKETEEKGPAAAGQKEEEQPSEADPQLKAAFIRVAQKMMRDADVRAWSKLELFEREEVPAVVYKFVYFRYHRGNGLNHDPDEIRSFRCRAWG